MLVLASALSCVTADRRRGGGTGGSEAHLGRVRLGVGDQIRHRLVGQVGIDDEHQRRPVGHHADQREVLDRVVGNREVVQVLHVGERIDEQRISVGLRPQDRGRAGDARGAGSVLDHDRLADALLHLRRQHARRDIGQPARRERHHEGDRPVGIGLRPRPRARSMLARRPRQARRICRRMVMACSLHWSLRWLCR